MGFFSKIWKGIKKGFKAVFKPIKKVFKSFGKFMNKLGVAGQIAMMFIPIPGLGALFSGLGNLGSKALGFMTKFGAVGKGAATLLGSAAKFAGAIAKPFINVTKAVKGFFENVTRFVGSKIPGVSGLFDPSKTPTGIFGGTDSAWSRASGAITDSFKGFKGDIASAASMDISDILPRVSGVDAAGNKIINYKGYDSNISDKNLKKTFGVDSDPYGDSALKDIENLELPTGKTSILDTRAAQDSFGEHPAPPEIDYPTPTGDTWKQSISDENLRDIYGKESDPYGDSVLKDIEDLELPTPASPKEGWWNKTTGRVTQSLLNMPGDALTSKFQQTLFGEDAPTPKTPWGSGYFNEYYSTTSDATRSALQPVQTTGGLDYTGGQEDVQDGMGFGGVENSAYNAYMTEFDRLPIMAKGLSSVWNMEPMGTSRQRAYMAGY